jgi:hypothetical protein
MDRFSSIREEFKRRLAMEKFGRMLQPVPGKMDMLCIENPFQNFNGQTFPAMRACLDFDELARQEWVSLFRTVLLFILIANFMRGIFVVLRQE